LSQAPSEIHRRLAQAPLQIFGNANHPIRFGAAGATVVSARMSRSNSASS
jgi:hypothetical protein